MSKIIIVYIVFVLFFLFFNFLTFYHIIRFSQPRDASKLMMIAFAFAGFVIIVSTVLLLLL